MTVELTKVYTDAGYNYWQASSPVFLAMVLEIPGEEPIVNKRQVYIPVRSSAAAEYYALIWAMSYCKRINVKGVHFMSDNETMVRQVQGSYRVKKKDLRLLWEIVNGLWGKLAERGIVKISHIKRKKNKADYYIRQIKKEVENHGRD